MEPSDVRLEITAAVAVDAHAVQRLVQELKDVPADAWCEVRNVTVVSKGQGAKATTTMVQMSCERRVADFLCDRFAKQTRLVSQGELLNVRCRRVWLRSIPSESPKQLGNTTRRYSHVSNEEGSAEKLHEMRRPGTLSRSTMVDLLDCLGDQIVDVLDVFESFAELGAGGNPQLTLLGLVQALQKLSKEKRKVPSAPSRISLAGDAKQSRKSKASAPKDPLIDHVAIHEIRHLLSQLTVHGAVAVTLVPERNDVPFMAYTDFIACYVAYMSTANDSAEFRTSMPLPSSSVASTEIHEVQTWVVEMRDPLESSMDAAFARSNNPSKSTRRKSRRHSKPTELSGELAFADMFLGVGELASHDDGLTSQRSESDDRRGSSTTSHRQRTRGSRSSDLGSTKKKSTASGGIASVTKPEMTASNLTTPGDGLFPRESMMLARQQLTSSASRVRPAKQQQPFKVTHSTRSTARQVGTVREHPTELGGMYTHPNNNEDTDEPIVEHPAAGLGRTAGSGHFMRGRVEWEIMHGVNQAGRLPTRSRRYLNYSAGSDGTLDPASTDAFPCSVTDESESSLGELHADRPPSRQRHAFPTHLLDPRDFFSPNKNHEGSSSIISMTPWHADVDEREEDETNTSVDIGPEEDGESGWKQHKPVNTNQRPPSRYMVKAARAGTSSSDTSPSSPEEESQGRLPSRRGAAGSRNQAAIQCHHDPKTDGFLAVDESVPPPFKVEISTDSNCGQYVASHHRRMDEERRHALKSRRSSSFGARSHVKTVEQQGGFLGADGGKVDVSSRNRSGEPQWFQELEPTAAKQRVVDSSPAAHIAAVRSSRSIVQPTTPALSDSDNNSSTPSTYPWFRSMNNPFFISSAAPSGPASSCLYDEMDAEAAIANTPLFAGEDDLMAMTQLTDLHLDDFMGDANIFNTSSVGHANLSNSLGVPAVSAAPTTTTASASLNTSLGRDFLSLFAQH